MPGSKILTFAFLRILSFNIMELNFAAPRR
jgi:hypothetical protein